MGKRKRKKEPKTIPPKKKPGADNGEGLASIIVPVHNRLDLTRLCIEAIRKCTPEGSYELIVIDNGSTDATPEYLAQVGAIAVRFPENRGIAVAWNEGIRRAKGRYLVFLHNDVLVSPGWLKAILRPFEDRKVACACLPHTEFSLHPDFPKLAAIAAALPSRTWGGKIKPFCFALSRSSIHRFGEFDEALSFGPYAEYDYWFRLEAGGFLTVTANDALVHHFGAQTALQLPEFYGLNDRRNWEYVSGKWNLPPMEPLSENPVFRKELKIMKAIVIPDKVPEYSPAGSLDFKATKPPRIVACISFYNDLDFLPGCLETLDWVDEIFLVDGAYADFPHEAPWSTDGSVEWIKERRKSDPRIRLIECERPWESEAEKRSAYFIGKEGDWYLIIDSDERVVGLEPDFDLELRKYLERYPLDHAVVEVETKPHIVALERYIRLVRHQPGLRYEATHFNIVADDKMVTVDSYYEGTISIYLGFKIVHILKDRSLSRREDKLEYYKRMLIREVDELKGEIVERWGDPMRLREYYVLLSFYSNRLGLLKSFDEAEAERLALDPKSLLKSAESPHLDTSDRSV